MIRNGLHGSRLVVGHKIFYRILREKFLKLTVELACQSLIMGNDQRRFIQCRYHIRHGKGLTGSGDTQQSLEPVALLKAFHQFLDCLKLIAGGLIFDYRTLLLQLVPHYSTTENKCTEKCEHLFLAE